MNELLPWFFLVLAGGALLTAIAQLWASFHAAFGGVTEEGESHVEAASRRALLEEKETLLRQLQELRFDRDAGKMSEGDFQELDGALRERAKKVLRLLDADIAPFRAAAEERIREHLGDKGAPYRGAAAKPARPRDDEDDEEPQRLSDIMKAKRKTPEPEPEPEPEPDSEPEPEPEAEAERKDCPDCGTDNEADAVFCKKCGYRFEGESTEDADDAEDEGEEVSP